MCVINDYYIHRHGIFQSDAYSRYRWFQWAFRREYACMAMSPASADISMLFGAFLMGFIHYVVRCIFVFRLRYFMRATAQTSAACSPCWCAIYKYHYCCVSRLFISGDLMGPYRYVSAHIVRTHRASPQWLVVKKNTWNERYRMSFSMSFIRLYHDALFFLILRRLSSVRSMSSTHRKYHYLCIKHASRFVVCLSCEAVNRWI